MSCSKRWRRFAVGLTIGDRFGEDSRSGDFSGDLTRELDVLRCFVCFLANLRGRSYFFFLGETTLISVITSGAAERRLFDGFESDSFWTIRFSSRSRLRSTCLLHFVYLIPDDVRLKIRSRCKMSVLASELHKRSFKIC